MARIEGAWRETPETQAVFDALEGAGYRAWLVGGCVRDDLAQRPVTDIDIATDAEPHRVMELAEAAGLRPVPTGIDHGTVTIVSGHKGYEVTTLRRDVETDGRRAVVAYSTDVLDDARRRDFTMNALYADRTGTVLDPLGTGVADLEAGQVRFIENARDRIREDYLRILRFFRFHAWYGDPVAGLDADALAAIAELAEGLTTLSRERVGHELLRLLAAPDPAPALAAMAATGALHRVLVAADPRYIGPLTEAETALGLAPDPVTRLAALGGQNVEEALRLSRADNARLGRLLRGASEGYGPAELGYRLTSDVALGALALRAAMMEQPVDPAVVERVAFGHGQVFPINGRDLTEDYWGPELGERLRYLERLWIDSDFSLSREALLSAE